AAYNLTTQADLEQVNLSLYFCPSRRRPTTQQGRYLMDYAAATPGPHPVSANGDSNGFWQGDTWDVPHGKTWRGIVVRTNWDIRPTNSSDPPEEAGSTPPVRFGDVRDGLSNTLLIGEKRLAPDRYESGDWHDDRGWTDGWDPDIMRSTEFPILPDGSNGNFGYMFGSPHPGVMMAVFGDGSVHAITLSIDRELFNNLGDRMDGEIVDLSDL
ncbi:MAG: DUF1559 domain-containing protein, partial [Planctomycetales bacterium]|nr:DUF1559 domain-containing protein [Planctomycetales bacterium]